VRADAAGDPRPSDGDPDPAAADAEAAGGPGSATSGWERYYRESGIRVETQVPARELTPKQARAAGARMVPALAALSARAAGTDRPSPLLLQSPAGIVLFFPETAENSHARAFEALRAALGL
jgi:hypothetical protein